MSSADSTLAQLARIDAICYEDSRHAFTQHVYYGYRKEAVEQFIWQRGHKPIGTGGFGSVFKEECVEGSRLGSARAVKYIKKPASSHIGGHIDYGRELEAIARSSKREYEPCFVQSEGWFETETDICIIMELVPLGSLQQYIAGGLPEVEAGLLVRQVLQGLQYMHGAGYAHRDLKPHNLLVVQAGPEWEIKIADFGLSKSLVEVPTSLRTVVGTAGFMAPEIMGYNAGGDDESDNSEDEAQPSYTQAIDIWAVGVIAYMLLTGSLPFTTQKILRRYTQKKIELPFEPLHANQVGLSGCSFIKETLAPLPDGRPNVNLCLQHKWTSSHSGRPHSTPFGASHVPSQAPSGSVSWNSVPVQAQNVVRSRVDSANVGIVKHTTAIRTKDKTKKPAEVPQPLREAQSPNAISTSPQAPHKYVTALNRKPLPVLARRKNVDGPGAKSAAAPSRASAIPQVMPFQKRLNLEGPPLPSLSSRMREYRQIDFSSDGKLFAARIPGYYIRLWDVDTAVELEPIMEPERLRYSAARDESCILSFSPDGTQIASGPRGCGFTFIPDSGPPRVYDVSTGIELLQLAPTEENAVLKLLGFLPDGRLALATWAEFPSPRLCIEVTLRDVPKRMITKAISFEMDHEDASRQLAVMSPDGRWLATNTRRNARSIIWTFDMHTGELMKGEKGSYRSGAVFSNLIFTLDGSTLAFEPRMHDITNSRDAVENLSSHDRKHYLSLYNIAEKSYKDIRVMAHPFGHQKRAFSPDGRYLVETSAWTDRPREIHVYDLQAPSKAMVLTVDILPSYVRISSRGVLAVAGYKEKDVLLWSMASQA